MTIAPHADAVHRLVDRLGPGQVEALYVILEGMVGAGSAESTQPTTESAERPKTHRFSFTGLMDAEPDLAKRSAQILRAEMGDPAT